MLRTNVETVSLIAGSGTRLCFFPDRLLIFGSQGVGAVNYRDLQIQYTETQFILNTSAPRDARVVDWTWQYVNKKGGPDRRFAHNPQLPIIHCERLHFTSPSGLNEMVQFSRPGVAVAFEQAVRQLTGVLNAPPPPANTPPPAVPSQSTAAAEPPEDAGSTARTILAVGAFAALAFIVWAAGTGKKKTLPSEVLFIPGPSATPLSAASPQAAKPTNTQMVAPPAAATPPLGVGGPPLMTASPDVNPAPRSMPAGTDFNRLVSESQNRAVAAHPALGKLGSPINTLFVKRYTALKAADSPRLHTPDWPEKLARECAGELSHR